MDNNNKIESLEDVYKWLKNMCDLAGFGLLNIWSFFKSEKKGMKGLRCVCDQYGLNRKNLNPDSIINYAHLRLAIPEIEKRINNTKYGRTHSTKFKQNWEALKLVVKKNKPDGPTPDRGIWAVAEGYSYNGKSEQCGLRGAMDDLAGAIGGCLWRNGENLKETITNYNKAREQIMDEIKKIIESGKLFYVYPHPSDDYESIIRALDFTLEHLNKLDPILTTDRKTDLMISLEKFKACIENGKIKIIFSYENK